MRLVGGRASLAGAKRVVAPDPPSGVCRWAPRDNSRGEISRRGQEPWARCCADHFAAAALWGFVDWDGRYPEVTVPRQGIGHRDGIRVHCSAVLEPRDVMRHKQIPVTSTARTIVDLAAVGNYTLLRRAVRRGLALGRVSIRQVLQLAGGSVRVAAPSTSIAS